MARGPVQSRYKHRLISLDTNALRDPMIRKFQEQTTAFKINLSYDFVLRSKETGRYKYYHSSCNCCGRYLDEPNLITSLAGFWNAFEKPTCCSGPSTKSRTLEVGVRTRVECHLLPPSCQRPSDRLRRPDPSRLHQEEQSRPRSGKR